MICNCDVCRHSYKIIGFKKYRKWNSKFVGRMRKRLHRLKSEGITSGYLCSDNKKEVEWACLKDNIEEAMCLYYEARGLKRQGNRRRKY